jgi:hypothetical protein
MRSPAYVALAVRVEEDKDIASGMFCSKASCSDQTLSLGCSHQFDDPVWPSIRNVFFQLFTQLS